AVMARTADDRDEPQRGYDGREPEVPECGTAARRGAAHVSALVTHPRFAPRRSARATTWWGRAWARAVEEASYGNGDLKRGQRLARSGAVGGIAVAAGTAFAAVVEGDDAWTTSVGMPVLDEQSASAFIEVVAAESGRIAALVA